MGRVCVVAACVALALASAAAAAVGPSESVPQQDPFFTSLFGVPVLAFGPDATCGRDAAAVGCVYDLAPPLYIRRDVLRRAHRQQLAAGAVARPGPAERAAALGGLVVLLHEWAHAQYGVEDEAQADCYAGQWLDAWYRRYGFSTSQRTLDERYFWTEYRVTNDPAAVASCFGGAWTAPALSLAAR